MTTTLILSLLPRDILGDSQLRSQKGGTYAVLRMSLAASNGFLAFFVNYNHKTEFKWVDFTSTDSSSDTLSHTPSHPNTRKQQDGSNSSINISGSGEING